jgi:hypothetical protein
MEILCGQIKNGGGAFKAKAKAAIKREIPGILNERMRSPCHRKP